MILPLIEGLLIRSFTALSETELAEVLSWRNDDRVRPWMDNTTQIELEDHLRFVEHLASREDATYVRVDESSTPVGVVTFVAIDRDAGSAEFGLYRAAGSPVREAGDKLMSVVEQAAARNGLSILTLHVRADNRKALSLYRKWGYTCVSHDGTTIYMEKKI